MNELHELAMKLASAELALRGAAELCPGDCAMQAGLLTRADWCKASFDVVAERITRGLSRRLADNPRRD